MNNNQQQQYAQPGPNGPPPRRHTARNVLLGIAVGLVLLVGGCLAVVGGISGEIERQANGPDTTATGRNQPRPVQLGVAFTIGKHRLDAGWRLTEDEVMGTELTGTVTNVSTSTSTAFFDVKFLRGNQVLAAFSCSTEDLEPGQSQSITCLNAVTTTGRVAGWDTITAEAVL